MSQTTEHAFETYVEEIMLTRGGWKSGSNAEWDNELAVNGLPVGTIELKNPGTGQTWRHAVRQYKEVISDRQVLDRQLQDAIYQIEHAQGVVKAIDQDSKQLAAALIDGTKIVITTLQKFPFVLRALLHAAGAERADEASVQEKEQAKAWEKEIAKRRYANPFDKFQLGLRQLLEDLMVQRMADNDKIVTRYMDDKAFGDAALSVLSKAIYDSTPTEEEPPRSV